MVDTPDIDDLDRRAEEELAAAEEADNAQDRKRHLDQAAMFAFESEKSRREPSS